MLQTLPAPQTNLRQLHVQVQILVVRRSLLGIWSISQAIPPWIRLVVVILKFKLFSVLVLVFKLENYKRTEIVQMKIALVNHFVILYIIITSRKNIA